MTVQCSCGRWYPDSSGVQCCERNLHSKIVTDEWSRRMKLMNVIETLVTVECGDCGATLRAEVKTDNGSMRVTVLPHVCAVDEPEP